jgi:hypothetical protein
MNAVLNLSLTIMHFHLTLRKSVCFLSVLAVGVLFVLLAPVSETFAAPAQTFGVVALSTVGSIAIIDGETQTASAPLLTGELGTYGGGLLDVAISPDGATTLVSNFGDDLVFFIDTSDPEAPEVTGSVEIGFSAEDIDFTPNGEYALVTDGGFSSKVAVIDVLGQTLVEVYNDDDPEIPDDPFTLHESVVVAPDGVTVLTADYYNCTVNAFTLSAAGHLTYVASTDVSNGETLQPVNLAIAPDGQTVVVAAVLVGLNPTSLDSLPTKQTASGVSLIEEDFAFPVLTITGPGQVVLSDMVAPELDLVACQSIVFSQDGAMAYLHCVQDTEEPLNVVGTSELLTQGYPNNMIVELEITAVGEAVDADSPVDVGTVFGISQLYGVDTLAMDNLGEYLYVSNPTLSDSSPLVLYIDVETNVVEDAIIFDPLVVGDPPSEPEETDSIPTGIAFWMNDSTPPDPEDFSPAAGSTVTDGTPTVTFTTDEVASCRMALTDKSYEEMANDVTCSGDGTTQHSCTAPDLGRSGTKTLYIACIDTQGNSHDRDINIEYTVVLNRLADTGSSFVQYGILGSLGVLSMGGVVVRSKARGKRDMKGE